MRESRLSSSSRSAVAPLFVAILAFCNASVVAADEPSKPPPADRGAQIEDPASDLALEQALDLERGADWAAALSAYTDALEKWPSRTEFRHRQRLCEIHYRLNRRYQDLSFHKVLLRLNLDQALALHDELLERIEIHYVEPVRLEPLLRRGIDNLEVALRDPTFIKAHIPSARQEVLTRVRNELAREGRSWLQEIDRTLGIGCFGLTVSVAIN